MAFERAPLKESAVPAEVALFESSNESTERRQLPDNPAGFGRRSVDSPANGVSDEAEGNRKVATDSDRSAKQMAIKSG